MFLVSVKAMTLLYHLYLCTSGFKSICLNDFLNCSWPGLLINVPCIIKAVTCCLLCYIISLSAAWFSSSCLMYIPLWALQIFASNAVGHFSLSLQVRKRFVCLFKNTQNCFPPSQQILICTTVDQNPGELSCYLPCLAICVRLEPREATISWAASRDQ